MASFPLAWNNGLLIAQGKLNLCDRKSRLFAKQTTFSYPLSRNRFSYVFHPLLFNYSPRKAQSKFLCCNKIKSAVNDKINIDTQLVREKEKKIVPRRKFSLRLRPRVRLLSRKLKGASIKSLLDGIGTFMRKNVKKLTLSTCVSVVLGLCFCFLKITTMRTPKTVPYAHLISSLQSGNVDSASFEEGTSCIYYNTKSWVEKNTQTELGKSKKPRNSSHAWEFSTRKIDQDVGYLLGLMRETGALYGSAPQSVLVSMRSMLITMLVLWIPFAPLAWRIYRQISVGNSAVKKRKSSKRLVCFEDVEGVDAAKVELMEIVCCLQGAINYGKLGAKLPRGVLLVGPPGTGKTLLARAVAGEAAVPFYPFSASEFVELFVGRGAARIRDLFDVARKNAPSIVFIDELDAVGGRRGRSFNDERDQTLNQLLTEMDGFESDTNVVVIAATNRPDALDPALCRPGRFSRKVYVGEPDEDGRKKILAIYLRGVPLEEDMGLICSLVASLTRGLVGADLANIVNEAALLAARRGAESVSREDVMEAVERAKFGINGSQTGPSTMSKKIGKLFPWMPSLNDGMQRPLGYAALSR